MLLTTLVKLVEEYLAKRKGHIWLPPPALFKHTSISSLHMSRVCIQDLIEIIPHSYLPSRST
jgi:hypothetical protein